MTGGEKEHKYDDIINLPHHVSLRHPQMPMINRAAQFAPFAALTGHEAAIRETARLTSEKQELDEYEKETVNSRLQMLLEHPGRNFSVTITYFLPDSRKKGGAYVDAVGMVKKVDKYKRMIVLADGKRIPIDDILQIEIQEEEIPGNTVTVKY